MDNHYQYDSCVGYNHIKREVMLIMIKKKYVNAFVIAATLAVPF
nr:S-layer protein [Bacillus cereus group sp. BfR-BA-01700]